MSSISPFLTPHRSGGGDFPGESLGHIRKGLAERRGVDSGGFHSLLGHLVLPGPQLLGVAHVGLNRILDRLRLDWARDVPLAMVLLYGI